MPGTMIQLFLNGLRGDVTTINIDEDATIEQLRRKVCEITGINDDELMVNHINKSLKARDENGKVQYLKTYNIGKDANLFVVLRLLGGSNYNSTLQPKKYGPDVQLTDQPDMFGYDTDRGGQRAKMPCGHSVSPDGLTAYCISQLTDGKFQFWCPFKGSTTDPFCSAQWDFFTVKRFALLTPDELKLFEKKMAENYLRKAVGIQECPSCKSFCQRKSNADRRVICPLCTKQANGKLYEFCWYCLNIWLGSGRDKCGNANCTGEDPRMRIIKNCTTKPIRDVPDCPVVRACPTCGILIEHKDKCKHMHCPCGQKFCFICLKKADAAGLYQCGSYNAKCEVAAIQTTLPGI